MAHCNTRRGRGAGRNAQARRCSGPRLEELHSLGINDDRWVENPPGSCRYSEGRCARRGDSSTGRVTSKSLGSSAPCTYPDKFCQALTAQGFAASEEWYSLFLARGIFPSHLRLLA